jgi:hypothetical protein
MPKTIAAIADGIPTEFSISSVTLVLGPIPQETAMAALSSEHKPFRDIPTFCAQCVTLMWQSVAPRNGQRYSLVVFEPLPTDDATQPVPAWIQALYSVFPGSAEKITSDIDLKTSEYRMVVTWPDRSFIGSKSIGDDLKLPHQLPDSKLVSHLKYVPLKGVRSAIARAFAEDGWKQLSGRKQAEIFELWKTSPHGRRLRLILRIDGNVKVTVLAERSTRREYEVPNSRVLRQVLENMRVVVKHLENTWVAEIEDALGPIPPNYKPGND